MVLSLLLVACDGGGEPTPSLSPVEQAAAAAKAIQADPAQADAALSAHGLTRDSFEALMYEIAADPEKSAAYRAALRSE